MTGRRARALGLGLAVSIVVTAVALAKPPNGGFEEGNLSGWKTHEPGGGDWHVYRGNPFPPPPTPRGLGGSDFPRPPRGEFAAIATQSGPGLNILHRKLRPTDRTDRLSFLLAYDNRGVGEFYTPNHFEFGGGGPRSRTYLRGGPSPNRNQQLIIDLIKPRAPLLSLQDRHILARLFRTRKETSLRRDYFRLSFNLDELGIHRRFRLRIAEVDNQGEFPVGVDAVRIVSRRD